MLEKYLEVCVRVEKVHAKVCDVSVEVGVVMCVLMRGQLSGGALDGESWDGQGPGPDVAAVGQDGPASAAPPELHRPHGRPGRLQHLGRPPPQAHSQGGLFVLLAVCSSFVSGLLLVCSSLYLVFCLCILLCSFCLLH